jgi:hypothetical protein
MLPRLASTCHPPASASWVLDPQVCVIMPGKIPNYLLYIYFDFIYWILGWLVGFWMIAQDGLKLSILLPQPSRDAFIPRVRITGMHHHFWLIYWISKGDLRYHTKLMNIPFWATSLRYRKGSRVWNETIMGNKGTEKNLLLRKIPFFLIFLICILSPRSHCISWAQKCIY